MSEQTHEVSENFDQLPPWRQLQILDRRTVDILDEIVIELNKEVLANSVYKITEHKEAYEGESVTITSPQFADGPRTLPVKDMQKGLYQLHHSLLLVLDAVIGLVRGEDDRRTLRDEKRSASGMNVMFRPDVLTSAMSYFSWHSQIIDHFTRFDNELANKLKAIQEILAQVPAIEEADRREQEDVINWE